MYKVDKNQKRTRSTKAQMEYQKEVISKKLEETLTSLNSSHCNFHTFFKEICEYCENMSEEERNKWGNIFVNYTNKDKLRIEQGRFNTVLNRIGYKRDSNLITEIITTMEKNYSTMLYDVLYYKHNVQLYSFKIPCTSAFKIARKFNIYREIEEKDLYIVMMLFQPFSSSQYIMETLYKLFEEDCLGVGMLLGGIYIIFKEQKKQNKFVNTIETLIKKAEYKNVKLH